MSVKKTGTAIALTIAILAWTPLEAGEESSSPGGDLGRLQGRWAAKAGNRRDIEVVLDVRGHRVDAEITTSSGLHLLVQGEVRIDETTSPRSLDWIKFNNADQEELPEVPAIYKLDRDTFVVCNGGFRGKRPSEFKPGEGVLAQVVTFRRVAKESAQK